MDQSFVGGVINHYQATDANDHILCVMVGRFTPNQRVIAQNQAKLNTKLYVDLITWFCCTSGHYAFRDVTPPEECSTPTLLQDAETDINRDVSQDENIENVYGGGTHTFTSAHDPIENTGIYKNTTEFTMAIINRASPLSLGYGGNYVNGKELKQFPFGTGGPKMKRPRQISEIECLKQRGG